MNNEWSLLSSTAAISPDPKQFTYAALLQHIREFEDKRREGIRKVNERCKVTCTGGVYLVTNPGKWTIIVDFKDAYAGDDFFFLDLEKLGVGKDFKFIDRNGRKS